MRTSRLTITAASMKPLARWLYLAKLSGQRRPITSVAAYRAARRETEVA